MKIIGKAAYLRVCPSCEEHARIVLADGSAGDEFCTKSRGLRLLESLEATDALSPEEALFLKGQIWKTDFPESDVAMETELQESIELRDAFITECLEDEDENGDAPTWVH